MPTITSTANLEQPTAHSIVTLSGTIKTDAQFSTQPVSGDQIIWPNSAGINVSNTLGITGSTGAHDVWHIIASTGQAVHTNYNLSSSGIASDSVNIALPSGNNVVTLSGPVLVDAQFTVQPVANDQIIYPNGISVSSGLVITAPGGTYDLWHIVASTGVAYKISYVVSGSYTTTINLSAGTSYTVATLASGFDAYVFQQWGVAPVAGEQIITLTSDGYFNSNGDYFSELEHVHDAWHIALDGTCTHFTVDGTGIGAGTPDTSPDQFIFTDVYDQSLSTLIESNVIVVTGVTAGQDIPVTITGGEYAVSTDGGASYGAWTTTGTNVQRNYRIKVRHTTSGIASTVTSTTLTVGDKSDTFNSTTSAATDTTPDDFSFFDLIGQELSTQVESNAVQVLGMTSGVDVAVSITGGEYAISTDGGNTYGTFRSTAGTIQSGNYIKLKLTTSASNATRTDAVLTVGTYSVTWSATTRTSVDATFFVYDPTVILNKFYGDKRQLIVEDGSSNWASFTLYNAGTVMSLNNMTNAKIILTSVTTGTQYESTLTGSPTIFNFVAADGRIDCRVGRIGAPEGYYNLDLVYYDANHTNGAFMTQDRQISLRIR